MNQRLVVSLHDAHPGSLTAIEEQVELLEKWGIQATSILVVPRFHAEPSINHVPWDGDTVFPVAMGALQKQGHELVLHGYYHQRVGPHGRTHAGNVFWTKFYTNNEAEFLDLPNDEARRRIEDGLRLFDAHGWKSDGFIAPAWLMPEDFPNLLKDQGFLYTNTLKSLILLQQCKCLATQSLCWSTRALWRRAASLRWNAWLYKRLCHLPIARLSLHPNDFLYAPIREQVRQLIGQFMDDGFEAMTYASVVRELEAKD